MSKGKTMTKTVQVVIGGYSNSLVADNDALDFDSPEALTRRSAIFPDHRKYGLEAAKVSAEVGEESQGIGQGFAIVVSIKFKGKQKDIEAWHKQASETANMTRPQKL